MKKRPFLTGILTGLAAGLMVAFLQPLKAADSQAELLREVQAIRKYTLDMAKQTREVAREVAEIKEYTRTTSEGVTKLNERNQFQK